MKPSFWDAKSFFCSAKGDGVLVFSAQTVITDFLSFFARRCYLRVVEPDRAAGVRLVPPFDEGERAFAFESTSCPLLPLTVLWILTPDFRDWRARNSRAFQCCLTGRESRTTPCFARSFWMPGDSRKARGRNVLRSSRIAFRLTRAKGAKNTENPASSVVKNLSPALCSRSGNRAKPIFWMFLEYPRLERSALRPGP